MLGSFCHRCPTHEAIRVWENSDPRKYCEGGGEKEIAKGGEREGERKREWLGERRRKSEGKMAQRTLPMSMAVVNKVAERGNSGDEEGKRYGESG